MPPCTITRCAGANSRRKIGGSSFNARTEVLVETTYGGRTKQHQYDYVIVARGFDPLWFTALLDQPTREAFQAVISGPDGGRLERSIGPDLSIAGLTPRLHLPMLAGVAQGPGFPN